MSRRKAKTYLMQLLERDHDNTPIEELMIARYAEHGSERAAALSLGITQQSFNTWKYRLGIHQAMLDQREQWLEADHVEDQS